MIIVADARDIEFWDLFDRNGDPLGLTHQRGLPLRPGQYHPVVMVFTVNSKGEILLTKRHPRKSSGGCFEVTGGCICTGEEPMPSALRELSEETGIKVKSLLPVSADIIELPSDPVVCYTYLHRLDIDVSNLTLQPEEVTEAIWASPKFLEALIPCGAVEPCTTWLWQNRKEHILKSIESWDEHA